MLSETSVPNSIQKSIALGRYEEAAAALTRLAKARPSSPIFVALASINLLLGDLAAAKQQALKAVEALPTHSEARALLARIRAALDEREAALADFDAVLDLAPPRRWIPPALRSTSRCTISSSSPTSSSCTVCRPVPCCRCRRHSARRRAVVSTKSSTRPAPSRRGSSSGQLGPRAGRATAYEAQRAAPERASIRATMTGNHPGLSRRRPCGLRRQSPHAARAGAAPALLPRIRPCGAAPTGRAISAPIPKFGLRQPAAAPARRQAEGRGAGLLGEHHLTYWWSFVCQHQRPGTDIHADQSDISLNFWITPDSANLAPEGGGLEMWNVAAPPDWTFNDYNADGYRIRLHLSQIGARQRSFAYAENRVAAVQRHAVPRDLDLPLRRRLREPAAQHHHAVPARQKPLNGARPRHAERL